MRNLAKYMYVLNTKSKDKMIFHFFRNVMIKLGYHGWELNLKEGHDSYCWIGQRRIDIGMDYEGDLGQIILHEIGHIDTARYCNQKHNPQFWKRVEYLIWKFLKTSLDKNQLRHKRWCSNGFYGIVYSEKNSDLNLIRLIEVKQKGIEMEEKKEEIRFEINIKSDKLIPPTIGGIEYKFFGEFSTDLELLSLEIKNELKIFIGKPLTDISRKMIFKKISRILDKDSENEER